VRPAGRKPTHHNNTDTPLDEEEGSITTINEQKQLYSTGHKAYRRVEVQSPLKSKTGGSHGTIAWSGQDGTAIIAAQPVTKRYKRGQCVRIEQNRFKEKYTSRCRGLKLIWGQKDMGEGLEQEPWTPFRRSCE
jgi:hypothetical protein